MFVITALIFVMCIELHNGECFSGYGFINGKCIKCPKYCAECNEGGCIRCYPPGFGSYELRNGECVKCEVRCGRCEDRICYNCVASYNSIDGKCVIFLPPFLELGRKKK